MKQKNVALLCLSMVLCIVLVSGNLKAQSNSQKANITGKAIDDSTHYPVLVQIPGGYRVEVEHNSLINKSQTALEVIKAIPGVFLRDSLIEVAGKKDLLLQVDGFDIKMEASQIADYLSTISGENIKAVEVILNPSARYNSVVGSVINIITRKSLSEGSFGDARASVGNINKGHVGADLYIVRPKYNFSVSLAENYNKTFNTTKYSYGYSPSSPGQSQTFDYPKIVLNNPFVSSKYNYKITDNHIIGGFIDYWGNSFSNSFTTGQLPNTETITGSVQGINKYYDRGSFGLYSISRFRNKSQLDLLLNSTFNNYNDRYKNHKILIYKDHSDYSSDQNEKYLSKEQTLTFKTIYKASISENILLETGSELIYSKFDNHFYDSVYSNTATGINNKYLNYYEYVAAPFLNLNIACKKWSYILGLRDEYCLYNYSSKYDGKTINHDNGLGGNSGGDFSKKMERNYLYPNASISFKISKKQLLAIAFKQVNNRPGLKLVQPYDYAFSVPILGIEKNPVSSKTSLADLSYILQPSQNQMYMFTGGLSYSTNPADFFSLPPAPVGTFPDYRSMKDIERKIYLSFSSQNNINKWFSLGTSFIYADIKYSVKNKVINLSTKNYPFVALSINGNIRLPEKISFNFSYQYNSSYTTLQSNINRSHYLNLVFNRSFFNKKIEAFLAISNPYHRLTNDEEYFSPRRQYKTISEAAVFRIGASYKFGKGKRDAIEK